MIKKLFLTLSLLSLLLITSCNDNTPRRLPTPTPHLTIFTYPTQVPGTPSDERKKDIQEVSDAVYLKYKAWESGEWDSFYNSLHSDSQKMITKDEFVAYWTKKKQAFPIKNYGIKDLKFAGTKTPSGHDKSYENVVEIIVKYDYEIAGQTITTNDGLNYVVKEGDQWKLLWKKS